MAEKLSVMLSEEEVDKRIREIAEQINKDYEGKEIHLIGVLRGASFFMCELGKRITVPVTVDFMSVSSYGNGTVSSGTIKIKKDLDDSIEGKHVILVEDIIDSGRTLSYLGPMLKERGAASVKLCTLLDKPDRREVDVFVDYVGYRIPDKFVVGYGLDYAQKYRNLPYIAEVELEEE
ncbi:MAG: hypoxanthine phosphoribosyltransferase [Lachnospiraceae bacterium]|nr:hypoxanthine phosphoribosyltransferase [Lachnospiraceae bacterium]